MNFSLFLQIVTFLAANKDTLKHLILGIEELVPDAPGAQKAGAVRGFIADALGIADKIEGVWPLVSPLFNLLVAVTKRG